MSRNQTVVAMAISAPAAPAMVIVPRPDDDISDQDHDFVGELGLHLAGAFFAAGL